MEQFFPLKKKKTLNLDWAAIFLSIAFFLGLNPRFLMRTNFLYKKTGVLRLPNYHPVNADSLALKIFLLTAGSQRVSLASSRMIENSSWKQPGDRMSPCPASGDRESLLSTTGSKFFQLKNTLQPWTECRYFLHKKSSPGRRSNFFLLKKSSSGLSIYFFCWKLQHFL